MIAQHYQGWMLSQRTTSTLSGYLAELAVPQSSGLSSPRGPLSRATINQQLAALSEFYQFVRLKYLLTRPDGQVISLWPSDRSNPWDAVDRLKVSPYGRSKYPTTEQLKAILGSINVECLTGKRDFALLYTIATTCRRFSEIINLRWGDIAPGPRGGAGDYIFKFKAKGKSRDNLSRRILPKLAYQAICNYLMADGRPPATLGETDYIFVPLSTEQIPRLPGATVEPNRPLSNSFVNRILKKYARRAGVPAELAHVHALRHAGARLRVELKRQKNEFIDLQEIQELLGHSQLNTTQIYVGQVLTDPTDPSGADAANALLPKGRRHRTKKTVPVQDALL